MAIICLSDLKRTPTRISNGLGCPSRAGKFASETWNQTGLRKSDYFTLNS